MVALEQVEVDNRANRRAVEWRAGNSFIERDTAEHFLREHPDPELR